MARTDYNNRKRKNHVVSCSPEVEEIQEEPHGTVVDSAFFSGGDDFQLGFDFPEELFDCGSPANQSTIDVGEGLLELPEGDPAGSVVPFVGEELVVFEEDDRSSGDRDGPIDVDGPTSVVCRPFDEAGKKEVRFFAFTINNWTPEHLATLRALPYKKRGACQYICFQPERGSQTGLAHIQGYVAFEHCKMFRQVHACLGGGAWLGAARGTALQNRTYCSKTSSRDLHAGFLFEEHGVFPVGAGHAGHRSDLDEMASAIQSGLRGRGLFEKHPVSWLRYQRSADSACGFYRQRRSAKTPCRWIFGPTGSGKSRSFNDAYPMGYWKSAQHHWWDGFDGQSAVIIDDYRVAFSTFNYMLSMLDWYPHQVQVKGGMVEFDPEIIYITCPYHPADIWSKRSPEDLTQLIRRIEVIEYMGNADFPDEAKWRASCLSNKPEYATVNNLFQRV